MNQRVKITVNTPPPIVAGSPSCPSLHPKPDERVVAKSLIALGRCKRQSTLHAARRTTRGGRRYAARRTAPHHKTRQAPLKAALEIMSTCEARIASTSFGTSSS